METHSAINKLVAPLPARPVQKKMPVPGAAQSPPFLLAVVGQPEAVDRDRENRKEVVW